MLWKNILKENLKNPKIFWKNIIRKKMKTEHFFQNNINIMSYISSFDFSSEPIRSFAQLQDPKYQCSPTRYIHHHTFHHSTLKKKNSKNIFFFNFTRISTTHHQYFISFLDRKYILEIFFQIFVFQIPIKLAFMSLKKFLLFLI